MKKKTLTKTKIKKHLLKRTKNKKRKSLQNQNWANVNIHKVKAHLSQQWMEKITCKNA